MSRNYDWYDFLEIDLLEEIVDNPLGWEGSNVMVGTGTRTIEIMKKG